MEICPKYIHQLNSNKIEGGNYFVRIGIIPFIPIPFCKLLFSSSYYAILPSSNLFKLLQTFQSNIAQPSFWKRKQMPQVKVFKQFLARVICPNYSIMIWNVGYDHYPYLMDIRRIEIYSRYALRII